MGETGIICICIYATIQCIVSNDRMLDVRIHIRLLASSLIYVTNLYARSICYSNEVLYSHTPVHTYYVIDYVLIYYVLYLIIIKIDLECNVDRMRFACGLLNCPFVNIIYSLNVYYESLYL